MSAARGHRGEEACCDRCTESAAFALWHVSGCAAGERALRVHVRDLASCALSEHAQASNVAALFGPPEMTAAAGGPACRLGQ